MHYLLSYETVDKYVEKRAPSRAGHLELAQQAHTHGLVMSGPLSDPADRAVLVF